MQYAGDLDEGDSFSFQAVKDDPTSAKRYKVIEIKEEDYDIVVQEYREDGTLFSNKINFNGYSRVTKCG